MLASPARRFFERASASLQRRLDRCSDQRRSDPRRHPNIKPLKGPLAGFLRYRVGDYRVVDTIDDHDQTVTVAVIAHRSGVYE